MAHYKFTSDLDTPIFLAVHAGRVCLIGKNQRKRIIYQGIRGGLYVKMSGKKQYLSQTSTVVITKGVRSDGGSPNVKR